MPDKQTLKWWIDHARKLEDENKRLRDYVRGRDMRIVEAVVERNRSYSHRDFWQRTAMHLWLKGVDVCAKTCEMCQAMYEQTRKTDDN